MGQPSPDLKRLRVISPCSTNWDKMTGDAQSRYCHECQKTVYNLSAFSQAEIAALMDHSGSQMCARITRREDGSIVTADSTPHRVTTLPWKKLRAAGIALAALVGLNASAEAQKPIIKTGPIHVRTQPTETDPQNESKNQDGTANLTGFVLDSSRKVIPNAKIILINDSGKQQFSTMSDSNGKFQFLRMKAGTYTLVIEAPGFTRFQNLDLVLSPGENLQTDFVLSNPIGNSPENTILVNPPVSENNLPELGLVAEVPCPPKPSKRNWFREFLNTLATPFRETKKNKSQ